MFHHRIYWIPGISLNLSNHLASIFEVRKVKLRESVTCPRVHRDKARIPHKTGGVFLTVCFQKRPGLLLIPRKVKPFLKNYGLVFSVTAACGLYTSPWLCIPPSDGVISPKRLAWVASILGIEEPPRTFLWHICGFI